MRSREGTRRSTHRPPPVRSLATFCAIAIAIVSGSASPRASCPVDWNVVPSSNATGIDLMVAVSAARSDQVWAAAHSLVPGGGPWISRIHLWDGTSWSVYPTTPPGFYSDLYGIHAVSPDDVWAVGGYRLGDVSNNQYLTMAEHWDGATWTHVPTPNPVPGWGSGSSNAGANLLIGVTGTAADDAWAAGKYRENGTGVGRTLIEHWDGSAWSIVPSPNGGTAASNNQLADMAALSRTDVWVVGSYDSGVARTLILHWDGSAWTIVPSPNVGSGANSLGSIVALNAHDIWAVGSFRNASNVGQTLALHWNGSAWSVVATPNAGTSSGLTGVDALAADDVWAVGQLNNGSVPMTLIEHWNGSAWSIVPSPNPPDGNGALGDITVVAPGDTWAVGNFTPAGAPRQTLALHGVGPAAPREVSSVASDVPLEVALQSGGDLVLSFEDLGAQASAYNIYEGAIGFYYSHAGVRCGFTPTFSGGRGETTLIPDEGDRYYLVTASNVCSEGTSGFASSQAERPRGLLDCAP